MKQKFVFIILFLIAIVLTGCFKFVDKDDNQSKMNSNSEIVNINYFDYFSKCNQEKKGLAVKNGDIVVVDYLLELENGEVKDTSVKSLAKKFDIYNPNRNYSPLIFRLGSGEMIKGFEKVVSNMKICDDKIVVIPPEEAYGKYDTGLVKLVPKSQFDNAGLKIKEGQIYNFGGVLGKIIKISGDKVLVDFNSPLAGKKLKFYIRLLDVKND